MKSWLARVQHWWQQTWHSLVGVVLLLLLLIGLALSVEWWLPPTLAALGFVGEQSATIPTCCRQGRQSAQTA